MLPGPAKPAGTTSLATPRPATVQVTSSVNHAVMASASRFAHLATNSPTMAILGAFPQSVGRTIFICFADLLLRLPAMRLRIAVEILDRLVCRFLGAAPQMRNRADGHASGPLRMPRESWGTGHPRKGRA